MRLMFSFTENERAYLNEMRAIITDPDGNEILTSLTMEETVFYMDYTRQFRTGKYDQRHTGRYLKLHDKHEAARLGALGIEQYLRKVSHV
jgi:hypothetical protein